jgi:hypothetical protein
MEQKEEKKTMELSYTQCCGIIASFTVIACEEIFEKPNYTFDEKVNFLDCLRGDMYLKGYRASLIIGFMVLLRKEIKIPLRINSEFFFDLLLSLFKYFHVLGFRCQRGIDLLIDYRLNPEKHPEIEAILEEAFSSGVDEDYQFIEP